MVLNPDLYRVLVKHFGYVKVVNEGVERIEERVPNSTDRVVVVRGESYSVDCPLCGDDRQRLSISYKWLSRPHLLGHRVTHLAHCYNESCEVHKEEFYGRFLQDLKAAQLGLLDDIEVSDKPVSLRVQGGIIPLPRGCVSLESLPSDHPSKVFLRQQYPAFNSEKALAYLSQTYGVMFTDSYDEIYPSAQDRVIFPVYNENGTRVAWQGRAIEQDRKPKWFLPPGFVKQFYNLERIPPHHIPVMNEGITNAIASGPDGFAIFGKELNSMRAQQLSERRKSVIVATDPDTFVPNNRKGGGGRIYANEIRDVLSAHMPDVRMIRWPPEVLALATRHNNNEEGIKVPDACDLGLVTMNRLLNEVR